MKTPYRKLIISAQCNFGIRSQIFIRADLHLQL